MSTISAIHSTTFVSATTKLDPGVALQPAVRSGTIPQHVLSGMHKAGVAFQPYERSSIDAAGVFAAGLNAQRVSSRKPTGKSSDVAQLDKAEALAQDAFRRVSDPNANFADKLRAQEEI